MIQNSDTKQIEDTTERASHKNPFLKSYTFTETDVNLYKVEFDTTEKLTTEQIYELGTRLYMSFRDSGYIVNVIYEGQSDTSVGFKLKYTGMKTQ